MTQLFIAATGSPDLVHLLVTFLVIVIGIIIIAGLIYCVETYIMKQPLPGMVRLVIGLVLIVLIIIWGLRIFGGG